MRAMASPSAGVASLTFRNLEAVAALRNAHPRLTVTLFRHFLDSRRVNPTIVEIEKTAHVDGVVNGFVRPAGLVKLVDIALANLPGVPIELLDKPEQRLFLFADGGGFVIRQHSFDLTAVAQQFRRTCGVALDSKRALIFLRREGGDQLAQTGAQGRRPAHDFVGKLRQVLRHFRLEAKQVINLGNLGAFALKPLDQVAVFSATGFIFHIWQEHGSHALNSESSREAVWYRPCAAN